MDAARLEQAKFIMGDPPHVAIRITAQQLVAAVYEPARVPAATNVGNDGGGDDLRGLPGTLATHQLAKPCEVAKTGGKPGPCHLGAFRVDHQVGIALAANSRPDAP